MSSAAFVELALKSLSCSQKDLASKLGVSSSQITKWKRGEYISSEMENEFRKIIKIDGRDPELVLWCGSNHDADKWDELIHYLADMAIELSETGYNTYPLKDEMETLCSNTIFTLKEMGVTLPISFPESLSLIFQDGSDDDDSFEVVYQNPIASIIYDMYKSLNDVYGFYAAFVSELINDDDLELYDTSAENIEPYLLSLAACKIKVDNKVAKDYQNFKNETLKNYQEWLVEVKNKAFRSGVPLRAELLDLINHSADELGADAESESLGFNSNRIHPDVYMNELLVGVRIIHQVLPAIMKKLGIDEEFELDMSDLKMK